MIRVSSRSAAIAVGISVLAFVVGASAGDGGNQSDALTERLLKFRVTGTFESFDPASGTVTFRFSGPFFAGLVSKTTGLVSDRSGPQVGLLEGARAQFHFDPAKGLSSDGARFSCDQCLMTFNDGSVLEPILDDPSTPLPEPSIPMEGRLLFELGPVPGGTAGTMTLRGVGCGGARETAGLGMFANAQGAICINGTFTFPAPLPATPEEWASAAASGESDCTFVFHVPAIG